MKPTTCVSCTLDTSALQPTAGLMIVDSWINIPGWDTRTTALWRRYQRGIPDTRQKVSKRISSPRQLAHGDGFLCLNRKVCSAARGHKVGRFPARK